jgi:hypothetical protein
MSSHLALIQRSNGMDLKRVEVQLTFTESSPGRHNWGGEFLSPSAAGILPNERLSLTLATGEKGTIRVRETHFNSRTPDATLIHFTGMGPLA